MLIINPTARGCRSNCLNAYRHLRLERWKYYFSAARYCKTLTHIVNEYIATQCETFSGDNNIHSTGSFLSRATISTLAVLEGRLIMAALCNRSGHYIFALWFLSIFYLSIFFLFSSPNLSVRRLDVYHTLTHGVALVRI